MSVFVLTCGIASSESAKQLVYDEVLNISQIPYYDSNGIEHFARALRVLKEFPEQSLVELSLKKPDGSYSCIKVQRV